MTFMFAEKFDGDGVYASVVVSITSILSVVTMPLVCGLARFY
jgi:ACR3 family arsenite efflux pump ArsB